MIDKLAWIEIRNKSILSTRSKGKDKYYIPGGKREKGESDAQALLREIKEEFSVELDAESLAHVGVFTAQAHGHAKGVVVQMTCYSGNYKGVLQPASEIEEMAWLNYSDMEKIAEVDKIIFTYLNQRGLLD